MNIGQAPNAGPGRNLYPEEDEDEEYLLLSEKDRHLLMRQMRRDKKSKRTKLRRVRRFQDDDETWGN